MKVECVKEKLAHVVGIAERLTGKNLSLPVLSCVFIEAKRGTLVLKATNLEVGIVLSIPAKVDEEGTAALPGTPLTAFLNTLTVDKSVKLQSDGSAVVIKTVSGRTTIKTQNAEDFPTIPTVPKEGTSTLPAADLAKALKAVYYSAATSSVKPELASVYTHADSEGLVFAATDSFRLAERRLKVKQAKNIQPLLIPFKNVVEIIRVLETAPGDVELHSTKHQLSLSFEGCYLTSRVIDGVFPDYKQIIPREFATEAIVLKDDLAQALRLANIFSDNFNQINIKINPKEKLFELSTKNGALGESANRLEATVQGEPVDANFNYRYIADCLQSISADSVSLSFTGPSRPLVIRGVSDRQFLYLVMPMNK